MNICFETFGCRLNRAEALQQEAEASAAGHRIVTAHNQADLIVIRGCSVTAKAQHDCEQLIAHLKQKYPCKRLAIVGCLPQATKDFFVKPPAEQVISTTTARAYLKVQDGCAGSCTFCIVPKFRGPSVSIPYDEVLRKARQFIGSGYHEIVVTGCNLSLYASQGKRLPELLAALTELNAGCRVRLGSLEPSPVAADVISVLAERPNFCRYLHIPIQSGSPNILRAMRRPYQIAEVEALIKKAREVAPDIAIGCDLMTGFPGEGELDFLATKGLLKRGAFAKAHIFPFSERPGTIAAALPGAIPRELRRARARELLGIAERQRGDFARKFLGKTVEFIVEDAEHGAGWTSEYLWCTCPAAKLVRKTRVRALVFKTQDHQLIGKVVD